jgi:hypothetical protein
MSLRLVVISVLLLNAACSVDADRQRKACIGTGIAGRWKGVVSDSMVFGAPGYGENKNADARYPIAILTLAEPLAVCRGTGKDSAYAGISKIVRVQLAGDTVRDTTHLRNRVPVQVFGRLYRATLASEVIDPMLRVDSISASK